MCDQQSLRSACAYAQSDQSLCLSLEYPMSVMLLTEHNLRFLSLKRDCTGLSETTLVKMLNCWKSHVITLFILQSQPTEESDEETAPGSTLFVKNLNFSTTDESLREVGGYRWWLVSCRNISSDKYNMGLDARKPVFGGWRTT